LTSPEALRALMAQVLTAPGGEPGARGRQRQAAVARGQRHDPVETRHQAPTVGRHDPSSNEATGGHTHGCTRKLAHAGIGPEACLSEWNVVAHR
jgi:hypothetical protein